VKKSEKPRFYGQNKLRKALCRFPRVENPPGNIAKSHCNVCNGAMHRYTHKKNLSFQISFPSARESIGSEGNTKEKEIEREKKPAQPLYTGLRSGSRA
jgi:hypothetical protein